MMPSGIRPAHARDAAPAQVSPACLSEIFRSGSSAGLKHIAKQTLPVALTTRLLIPICGGFMAERSAQPEVDEASDGQEVKEAAGYPLGFIIPVVIGNI